MMLEAFRGFSRYPSVSEADARWGLCVTGIGFCDVPPGSPFPATSHPAPYHYSWEKGRILADYEIMYLVGGEAKFDSALAGSIRVKSGSLILMFPRIWHRCSPVEDTGWKNYWVNANGEHLDRLVNRGLFSPQRPVLEIGLDETLLTPWSQLLDLARNEQACWSHVMAAKILEIVATALAVVRTEPECVEAPRSPVVEDRMVAKALRIIWEDTERDITVNEIVARLPLSQRTLERRFRRILGRTIQDEIVQCRLYRAKQLLVKTTLPISHVAYAAGFQDVAQMGKFFRRNEGISPSAFRRQHCNGSS